jgi:nucleotide-binding universal stress UspA family protein
MRPPAALAPLDVLVSPDPVDALGAAQARASELATRVGADLCQARVLEGEPVSVLLAQREQLEVDLVVLGTRGLHGVRRFILGSVAQKMLRHPGCPLLLVSRVDGASRLTRMLVAQADPSTSSPWLELGVRLAHDERFEVTALHVVPTGGPTGHLPMQPKLERASASLGAQIARLDPKVVVDVLVRPGEPGPEIVRAGHELAADLVVLGAERNRLDREPGAVVMEVVRSELPAFLVVWPDAESDEEFESDE